MTDETLIKSADLIGRNLVDPVGGKLGVIRELYLHRQTGQAQFAIVDAGGFLSAGGKFHVIPWRLLRFDEASGDYAATLTKERLKSAPAYDRDQLNSTTYGWSEQIERFFESPSEDSH
jgi:hypothetical protein